MVTSDTIIKPGSEISKYVSQEVEIILNILIYTVIKDNSTLIP